MVLETAPTFSPEVMGAQQYVVVNPTLAHVDRFGQVYELRRSKRVKKKTKCCPDGLKCV